MNNLIECFNIILNGEKETSKLATKSVRKLIYTVNNRDDDQAILKIVNNAPFEYAKIQEDWRQENFVKALSVIDHIYTKEKNYDILLPWMFQLLQHENGNIRFSVVKIFEFDIAYLSYHLRCEKEEKDKLKSEDADKVLHNLFLNLDHLITSLWKPIYDKYQYIDLMPASPYKSVQMVISVLIDFCGEDYFDDDIPSNISKSDCYFDAMDCLCSNHVNKAIKLLNKSLEIDSHYLPGYVGLSSAYLNIGDMEKHKEYTNKGFDEVKKVYPQWPDCIMWGDIEERSALRIISYKAMLEHKQGNLIEAESLYRLLLKLNPSDNQGARYLIAAMFAGHDPEYVDELIEKGNNAQEWDKLESLLKEQNKKHKFF